MASPRMSRFSRQAELEMERTVPRVGLSDYTSQRLAELRARRAAQEDDLSSLGLSPRRTGAQPTSSNTGSTSPSTRRTVLTDSSSGISSLRRPLVTTESKDTSSISQSGRYTTTATSHSTAVNGTADSKQDTSIGRSSSLSTPRSKYTGYTRTTASPDDDKTTSSTISSPRRTVLNVSSSESDRDSGIASNNDYKPRDSGSSTGSSSFGGSSSDIVGKSSTQSSITTPISSSTPAAAAAAASVISKTTPLSSSRSFSSTTSSRLANSTLSSQTASSTESPSLSEPHHSTSSSKYSHHSGSTQPQTSYNSSIGAPGGGSSLNQQLENYSAKKIATVGSDSDTTSSYSTTSELTMSSSVSAARAKLSHITPDLTKECKEYKADYKMKPEHGSLLGRSNSKVHPDTDDEDSVGFSSLPEQVHRKALKRGFDFTLMVVGESGLGKSTLIQSLFLNTDLYNERNVPDVEEKVKKTVTKKKKVPTATLR